MLKSIQELKLHDHTCLMFNTEIEFFHCAVPYVNDGLKKNEQCILVLDEITKEDSLRNFKYLLREQSTPLKDILDNKRLIIKKFKNIYLSDGNFFNIDDLLKKYLDSVKEAILMGFSGLRVFAEISQSMKHIIGGDDFLSWEKVADLHFGNNKFLAVCAYNKKYFNIEYLKHVKKVHSIEIDLIKTRL